MKRVGENSKFTGKGWLDVGGSTVAAVATILVTVFRIDLAVDLFLPIHLAGRVAFGHSASTRV